MIDERGLLPFFSCFFLFFWGGGISEDRKTLRLMRFPLFYVYVSFLVSVFKFDLQARVIQTLDTDLLFRSCTATFKKKLKES